MSAPRGAETILRTPYGHMHINLGGENDHAEMRAKQLAGLLTLMSCADEADDMLSLARQLGVEVVDAVSRMARNDAQGIHDAAVGTRQIAQLLLLIQPEDGAGDMLWLAIQLADELAGTVAGMSAVGGAS